MKKLFKFINNPKFRMISILTFLLFIYISLCAISYAKSVSTDISESVLRLHVLANSDSAEDQNLKYKVRDKLIEYMNSLVPNCSSKEEAISTVSSHKEEFKQIALNTIHDEGFNYDVTINIGSFEFPTKYYGDITLPAGLYDALRVEIGQAKGQNWWCVMFPPLCFVDVTSGVVPDESKDELKSNLSEEEFALISTDKTQDIKFKFKLLEIFANKGIITAKK